ncbi:MAG: hypothetical protein QME75_01700 [Deltaproteobacteria bacterium]|nr:hypothetical protein [Deltaproteobacteria bacterium]
MQSAHGIPWPGWHLMQALLVGGLVLKLAVSGLCLAPTALWDWAGPKVSEAATHAAGPADSPPSLPRLFSLMHQERSALQARASAVAVKEEQLRILQKEVEDRLQELKGLQLKILDLMEEEKRIKHEHNRHLVSTLTAMPADRAARLLEKMEEETAVMLLRNLKGKEAGAILAVLSPDKAARLSQRLLQ